MSAIRRVTPISVETYLARENASEHKHELVGGYLVAMVGASHAHGLITGNLYAAFREAVRGTPCRAPFSDMKVQVGQNFYYPDLVVTCTAMGAAEQVVRDPVLIVEVLFQSTEARDRNEKRIAYQSLPSLADYLLVAQDEPRVEVFRRAEPGWEVESYGPGETIRLIFQSLGLAVDQVYEGVAEG